MDVLASTKPPPCIILLKSPVSPFIISRLLEAEPNLIAETLSPIPVTVLWLIRIEALSAPDINVLVSPKLYISRLFAGFWIPTPSFSVIFNLLAVEIPKVELDEINLIVFTSVVPVIEPLTDNGPLIVAARPTILPATWPVKFPVTLPVTPPSTSPLNVVAVTTPETLTLVESTWVIVDIPLTILHL